MSASPAPSLRARLTTWYAVALTALLLVYATATYLAVRHQFREQLDQQLHEDLETAQEALWPTPSGAVEWSGPRHQSDGDDAPSYEVWSTDGQRLHRSGSFSALPPAVSAVGSARYDTAVARGEEWRSLTASTTVGDRHVVLRVARSEEQLQHQLGEVLMVLMLGLPLVVALAGVAGFVLAKRALAPMDHLASATRRITAERLHERLTAPNPTDEIGRLTGVINEMIGRLEASFDQLRRFTADASHELRTPLAVVKGIGEAALGRRRQDNEYEEAIGSMLEEVDRMSSLVDTLLRLSHGDAGTIRLNRAPSDLGQLVREATASLGILAEERRQRVTVDVAEGVVVPVDRMVVREAVTNVLDNAIKYSPPGSTVAVRVSREDHHGLLTVTDAGPGIPAEHRERIFHRFFRIDEARSRDHGGAGLGLAIAKWAVDMHGGEIGVNEAPGGGAEFRILLPLEAAPGTHGTQRIPTGVGGES